jgi:hypothetical protein
MSSLTSLVSSSAFAFSVPLDALAPLLGIFVILVALVLSAGLTRAWFARYKDEFAEDDTQVIVQLTGFASVSVGALRDYPSASLNTASSILSSLFMDQPAALLTLLLFAVAGGLWNKHHAAMASAFVRLQQCDVLPILNDTVLSIANFVRLIFDAVWPLVTLGTNYYSFITSGWYRVLRECSIETVDADAIFDQLAAAAKSFADAIVTFFAGDIFNDRFLMTDLLTQIGLFADFLMPVLNCYCAWLEPVWVFATSLPQMQALHSAIEASVNAGLRVLQIILNAITNVEAPFWSTLAEELILLVISVGETFEQASILALNLLTDLVDQIFLSAQNDPAGMRALFGLPAAYDEESGELLAPTLSELFHATANTKLSTSSFAVPQGELGAALRGPIWNLPNNSNASDYLGFPVVLALLQTPWSHAVTELGAAAIILANMTINIVSNPVVIFATPEALAYLQFGPVFDRLKAAFDAAAQLLVIIDPSFPDAVSLLGQAVLTYAEGAAELIVGTIIAIVWPTWSFGEPPPTDCTTPGSCAYPAPDGWTVFNIYPDYYDWENNALRRALLLLEQDADAIAILLGCNETTIATDDCTDLPFQCAIRTAYLLAVEAVNQTNSFIFYLPDLVQFDSTLKTFQDLDPARLQELFYLFIECLTTWYLLSLFTFYFTRPILSHSWDFSAQTVRK